MMAEVAGTEPSERWPLSRHWPRGRRARRHTWASLQWLMVPPFGLVAYVVALKGSIVLLAYLAAGMFALAVMLWPFVGLAALTGIFAAEYLIPVEGAMTAAKAIGWVTLFSVICRLGIERRLCITMRPVMVYMLILLGLMGISVFTAHDEGTALVGLGTYTQLVALVFITMHLVTSERRMVVLVWTFLAVVGASAVVGIVQYAQGGMMRAVGLVADPNMFSLAIGIALPFVMAMIRRHSVPLARVALSFGLAILVAAEAVSFSRSGYIAFAVGLLLGVIRFVRPLQTLTGTLAFMVLVVAMGFLPSTVWRRAESIPTAILRGRDTMKIRYDLWRTGVAMIAERPLLGVGLGNTRIAAPHYRPPGAGLRRLVLHNTYLDIGAEVGIPALVIFLLLLGAAWREARRSSRVFGRYPRDQNLHHLAQCVEIGLIVCMIQAIALSLGTTKIVWMILAWCVTLARLAARGEQSAS